MSVDLRWPKSVSQLKRIQSERKRIAVERARQSRFLKKRIPKGKAEDIWHRIPPLTKEELRAIPPQRFHEEFCIQPRSSSLVRGGILCQMSSALPLGMRFFRKRDWRARSTAIRFRSD